MAEGSLDQPTEPRTFLLLQHIASAVVLPMLRVRVTPHMSDLAVAFWFFFFP